MIEAGLIALLPDGVGPFGAGILVLASFFTSALTASAGVGGGLALLGLMTYIVPITALIPVHGVVQLGSNAGRSFLMRAHIAWACLLAFLVGAVPGAVLGRFAVGVLPETAMQTLLGVFILVLTWVRLPKMEGISGKGFAVTGFITTAMTMVFGATGPFNAVVLSKAFADRLTLVATMASVMTAQHLVKIVVFAIAGFAFADWAPLLIAMMATGFAGTWAGRHLLVKMSEERFRLVFNIGLSLLALDLIRRSLG
ncbi:sulfite exporter TauE/SafE family protein [Pseudohoeflea suaedae]|uniref:Probable membrane transporter protein n=1 Tax=Pseudohoeflea suaedae TaxID=877384 RepID=A0A4R5PLR2_9HYPH|nr:sulfite exporter TauE/SafE family protein [Pseudohoeflea suaedae]TDH37882.1 sulfite exporter TauE/SafE family protein [Pseudohoeflea suaedae]